MTRTLPSSLLLLLTLVAATDAGATTTTASTTEDTPSATVVIYRSAMREATAKLPVRIDQTQVGDTVAHSYLRRQLAAGAHRFDNGPGDEAALQLDLQPGQTYFIEQDPGLGPFSAVHLRNVDAATARSELAACLPLDADDQLPLPAAQPSAALPATTASSHAPTALTTITRAPAPAAAQTPAPSAPAAMPVAAAARAAASPADPAAAQPLTTGAPSTAAADSESSAPLTTGLAIEDPRVDEQAFTAAQHIATDQQCDAMLRLQSVQGEHAVFYTQCKARQQVLYIGCNGSQCHAQPGAAP